jgi:thiamine transport system ATP-binding protein
MTDGLTIERVTVAYQDTVAVDDVSLQVRPGETVALLGPSGSGKSSLLRAVAGLEPLRSGTVAWDGVDLARTPVHERGFTLMFQDGQLFPHRTVAGNIAYGLNRLPKPARLARVDELLSLVGLEGFGNRPVTALSGGQAQRVALARSLAPKPRLLLLDEPLSSLDRALREHLATVLKDILATTGTPALHVTHDQDEAFTLADRVAILDHGKLLQVDPPTDLWLSPADDQVAAFLGHGPALDQTEAAALGVTIPDGATLRLGRTPRPAGGESDAPAADSD